LWDNSATTEDITGLAAGTYSVTVIDANGCTTTASATITQPSAALSATVTGQTNVLCNGNSTGAINLSVSGGTSSYSYLWSNSATTEDLSGLAAGTYSVTVTDANGCTTTASATITQPSAALSATISSQTNVLCNGNSTGAINLSVSGGTSSYSYLWNNSATTGDISGLAAGTYSVTVTDANGCTTTASATITQPSAALSATVTGQTNVLCNGNSTGSINLSVTGGTSSYSYLWNNGATTEDLSGLAAGTYSVVVTDANGCTTTASATITQPSAALSAVVSGQTNVLCNGNSTGAINLSVSGGTSSYTYLWNNSATTEDLSSLAAGTYSVTVTDANGCTTTASATITQPSLLIASIASQTNVTCNGGSNGLATISVSGGTSSYAYSWAPISGASPTASGLPVGTYTCTVTDAHSCTATRTVTITEPASLAAISGTGFVCVGSATSLSHSSSGGTWSSGSSAIASVGSATGVVTGNAAGAVNISYILPSGCMSTITVTVNPKPAVASIIGAPSVCKGYSTTFTEAATDGIWSSGNELIATVAATGVVYGVAAGTTVISYSVTNVTGCTTVVAKALTVNALPYVSAIGGVPNVCYGFTTTLANSTSGGVWVSGNPAVATIGVASGVVSGLTVGTSMISYTVTNVAGCAKTVTAMVSVNGTPSIGGPTALCTGATTTMANAAPGGTWASSNNLVAVIGPTSGVLTGLTVGTTKITYTLPTGCINTLVITVNPTPPAITGSTGQICLGATATMSNAMPGGTWASSNSLIASVNLVGIVTGGQLGVTTIHYTLFSGCSTAITVTVNPYPAAITGSADICTGNNITLANTTPGGSWSSSDGAIATIGASSGIVAGGVTGVATITYTSDKGCGVTTTVNNPLNAINGTSSMCINNTQTLIMATPGGTWSISDTSVARISSAGVVTSRAVGTATVTYSIVSGCYRTLTFTVASAPTAIVGPSVVCVGSAITLSSAASGGSWSSYLSPIIDGPSNDGVIIGMSAGVQTVTYKLSPTCYVTHSVTVNPQPPSIAGISQICKGQSTTFSNIYGDGLWSTSNATVATASPFTGYVEGISAGTARISYTFNSTGCATSRVLTVNPLPTDILGTRYMCVGGSTTLSSATGMGISWTSSTPAIATVNTGNGVVTGVTPGSATITYTVGSGCYTTAIVTVSAPPSAITGPGSVCAAATITLADADMGGVWASSNPSVAMIDATTGVVTGATAGYTTITYTYGLGIPCATTRVIAVNPLPTTSGSDIICKGSSSYISAGIPGGTWTSNNTSVATVVAPFITGVSEGNAIISYTLPTGCFATMPVTINPLPNAITGTASVSIGISSTLSTTSTDGVWSSNNVAVAAIDSATGIFTGMGAGTTAVSYVLPTGCYTTKMITVVSMPAVGGSKTACEGGSSALTYGTYGGTWSSSNLSVATVGSVTGLVSAISAGTTIISYHLPSGVYNTTVFTVTATPTSITAAAFETCSGSSVTLSHAETGGTWASSATSVAAVGASTGIVTGVGASGTATITYTISAGCKTTAVVTVNPLPAAITGAPTVCEGSALTLSNTTSGGVWSSNDVSIANIDSASGIITAGAAGTAVISYTMATGCYKTTTVNVNADAGAITGPTTVCIGTSITLIPPSSDGTWSATYNPSVISGPGSTGVITGVGAGTAIITYTVPGGCKAHVAITVVPAPGSITGALKVCVGQNTTLGNFTAGGTWSAANSNISVGGTTGIVTGLNAGTSIISYTVGSGCYATAVVTVNPVPTPIMGTLGICYGTTTTLSNTTTPMVSWSTSNAAVATVGATSGIVSGVAVGSADITYRVGSGCFTVATVTVNPNPASISGTLKTCFGETTSLSNADAGGTWVSSNTGVAIIGTSGVVTGMAAGTTNITYTLSGCRKTAIVTVNAAPSAITGYPTACVGTMTVFSNTASGTWASSDVSKATVTSSPGNVTGVAPGTANITFTQTTTGCSVTRVVSVIATPAIIGTAPVCGGATLSLTGTTPGGTWSSSNTVYANVGSATGVVTAGTLAGNVAISYNFGAYCRATAVVTVRALPAAIAGVATVCNNGVTTTLTSATGGGIWSSSSVANATVGSAISSGTGIVTGVAAGTSIISYTLASTGCARSVIVTVNACTRGTNTTATEIDTVQDVAAIENISMSESLAIYPNPNKGQFTLKGKMNSLEDAGLAVEITNMLGQIVYSNNVATHNGLLDEQIRIEKALANGMYILNLRTKNATKLVHFVIEQ
jgi:uncharacterized protein YjdB